MRKTTAVILFLAMSLAVAGCEIPDVVVETIISGGQEVATKVAQALTETAAVEGPGETPGEPPGGTPAETLPAGGGPGETETLEPTLALTPTPTVTATTPPPHLRVAFISSESPWMVEPPAAPFQLAASTGVDGVYISDDGMLVAYVRHTSYSQPAELRVVNSDGTNDRALLTSAQVGGLETLPAEATNLDLYEVKWIPGTHNLLINTLARYMGPGLARFDDLFQVNADTGVLTTVLTAGNAGEVWPSPDGTKMVISRATYISLANIDGTGVVPNIITFPSIMTYSEYQYYPEPVWAADSLSFGVIIASADPLAAVTSGAIWLVNASTGAASLASTLNGNFFFPRAVLSPVLDRVGYVVTSGSPSVTDSYVSFIDGSSGLHLGTGTTGVDSFAPDGQHFVYYVGSPTTKYVGSLGGGTILIPGGAMNLKWYNNTHFVYSSGTMASWTLNIGDSGGGSTVITSPSGNRTTFDVDE